jgi:hypothetical protein
MLKRVTLRNINLEGAEVAVLPGIAFVLCCWFRAVYI